LPIRPSLGEPDDLLWSSARWLTVVQAGAILMGLTSLGVLVGVLVRLWRGDGSGRAILEGTILAVAIAHVVAAWAVTWAEAGYRQPLRDAVLRWIARVGALLAAGVLICEHLSGHPLVLGPLWVAALAPSLWATYRYASDLARRARRIDLSCVLDVLAWTSAGGAAAMSAIFLCGTGEYVLAGIVALLGVVFMAGTILATTAAATWLAVVLGQSRRWGRTWQRRAMGSDCPTSGAAPSEDKG
jgi:hypothetical protein